MGKFDAGLYVSLNVTVIGRLGREWMQNWLVLLLWTLINTSSWIINRSCLFLSVVTSYLWTSHSSHSYPSTYVDHKVSYSASCASLGYVSRSGEISEASIYIERYWNFSYTSFSLSSHLFCSCCASFINRYIATAVSFRTRTVIYVCCLMAYLSSTNARSHARDAHAVRHRAKRPS